MLVLLTVIKEYENLVTDNVKRLSPVHMKSTNTFVYLDFFILAAGMSCDITNETFDSLQTGDSFRFRTSGASQKALECSSEVTLRSFRRDTEENVFF